MAAVGESRSRTTRAASSSSTATPPGIAEIDGDTATFDARELTTRKINAELRRLVYEEGIRDVTIAQPGRAALARRRDPARAAGSRSRAASATSAAA